MNLRQRSIIELKNAVINKTLGCYNENVVDEGRCLYFHGDTGTCCAVGAIIPHDELFNNVDDEFNVSKVFNNSESDTILEQLGNKNKLYGMDRMELKTLQKYHDDAVLADFNSEVYNDNVKGLESFVEMLTVKMINKL